MHKINNSIFTEIVSSKGMIVPSGYKHYANSETITEQEAYAIVERCPSENINLPIFLNYYTSVEGSVFIYDQETALGSLGTFMMHHKYNRELNYYIFIPE